MKLQSYQIKELLGKWSNYLSLHFLKILMKHYLFLEMILMTVTQN